MNPAKLTQAMLIKWGGKDVYQQAEYLVKKGAVKKAEVAESMISGIIARESASDLHTKLRVLDKGDVESHCPCYTHRNQGLICPHVVALGISVMLRSSDPMREEKYQQEQRRNRRLAGIDPACYIQRSPDGTPAALELSLSADWTDEFHQGTLRLAIFFSLRNRTLPPAQIPAGTPLQLSEQDDALLMLLEEICEGPPSNPVELSPADFINLVEIAGGKSITAGANTQIKVETSYVLTHLNVTLNHTTGALIITPQSIFPQHDSTLRPSIWSTTSAAPPIWRDGYGR